jgi:hypothetical protein
MLFDRPVGQSRRGQRPAKRVSRVRRFRAPVLAKIDFRWSWTVSRHHRVTRTRHQRRTPDVARRSRRIRATLPVGSSTGKPAAARSSSDSPPQKPYSPWVRAHSRQATSTGQRRQRARACCSRHCRASGRSAWGGKNTLVRPRHAAHLAHHCGERASGTSRLLSNRATGATAGAVGRGMVKEGSDPSPRSRAGRFVQAPVPPSGS